MREGVFFRWDRAKDSEVEVCEVRETLYTGSGLVAAVYSLPVGDNHVVICEPAYGIIRGPGPSVRYNEDCVREVVPKGDFPALFGTMFDIARQEGKKFSEKTRRTFLGFTEPED